MSIPEKYKSRRLFHFTHIDNIEEIIRNKGLLAKNDIVGGSQSIAYSDIQDRRAVMNVPVGPGGVVHDYVPFYFCSRSPMLYAVVSHKIAEQSDIVYLEFPISLLESEQAVFTDSSANSILPPNFYTDVEALNQLDWSSIDTWSWSSRHDVAGSLPVRKKKMAEGLIYGGVSLDCLTQIVAWGTNEFCKIGKLFKKYDLAPPRIYSNLPYNRWYYYRNKENESQHIGPRSLSMLYNSIVSGLEKPSSPDDCSFSDFENLKNSLDDDFACVGCTADCVGLESSNDMHENTVDEHIKDVVTVLRSLEEFNALEDEDKILIELAAYFHDVGKGPKSRWGGPQRVDPDHPAKSLRMVSDLLNNDIAEWSLENARLLCKLVCYHDLVGMIMNSGRQLSELVSVSGSERELVLLTMLSKADACSVNKSWWSDTTETAIKDDVLKFWG